MNRTQKINLARILVTAGMLLSLHLFHTEGWPRLALSLAAYLLIGADVLREALTGLFHRRVFDENFLMAVATLGAFALAIYTQSGDYLEGIAVMLFYQIGEWFQSCAVEKSRKNITALMDIRPDYANLEKDGRWEKIDPDNVPVGSVIVVQPGEKVPLDGVVLEGTSGINTAALTGESAPREVTAGSEIFSGCINLDGVLRVRTTKVFGESTVSKVLEMVEDAGARKSRTENFISRFARIYTPAVCIAALTLAILPPLVQTATGTGAQWSLWIYRALIFLVVSCPCALVVSVPLAFFAGLGGAGRAGILIKGAGYLEALSQVKYVVFDKTGTLTRGVFEVAGIHHNVLEDKKLLEYAALAESASGHPISKSLREAYGGCIDRSRVSDIREISGRGISARVDGRQVLLGNAGLMEKYAIPYRECHSAGTVIHIAVDGGYAGHILVSDTVKPRSAEAISALKKAGVKKTVMLTGDRGSAARQVAEELGVDDVYSELMPGDKVAELERVLEKCSGKERTAFVGDGINDAPVLRRADVGIAMGAMGSDAAIEAADVVLMDDDPAKIAKGIRISRKCMGIVRQNIIFTLAVKFACLILAALGLAGMRLAVFADVGVMVLAVLNAIRALRVQSV